MCVRMHAYAYLWRHCTNDKANEENTKVNLSKEFMCLCTIFIFLQFSVSLNLFKDKIIYVGFRMRA